MLLTNTFDFYKKASNADYGMYGNGARKSLELTQGGYILIMTSLVFISAIAMIISGILYFRARRKSGTALAEAKEFIEKTFLVTFLSFIVTGLVTLIQLMAIQ